MDRLDLIEKDLQAHAKSITEMVQEMARTREDTSDEVRALREEIKELTSAINSDNRVSALEKQHQEERMRRIEARLDNLYSLGKWALLAFFGALLTALVTFIVRGGLVG